MLLRGNCIGQGVNSYATIATDEWTFTVENANKDSVWSQNLVSFFEVKFIGVNSQTAGDQTRAHCFMCKNL